MECNNEFSLGFMNQLHHLQFLGSREMEAVVISEDQADNAVLRVVFRGPIRHHRII
jgi:hypothetical protein